MNLIKGLKDFKERKRLSNADLSRLLGVSDSMISQYLSGKSGMSLEEAFDEETAAAVKKNIFPEFSNPEDPLQVVVEGLRRMLEQMKKD